AEPGTGLQRLCRLVDQRLSDSTSVVRTVAVEPLVTLLLDDDTPWIADKHLQDLFRGWLRALVVAGTPSGHPLRVRLRDQLAAACAAADRRLQAEQEAAAAARAARSPEEIDQERRFMDRHRNLFAAEIGYPRTRRRGRPGIPREITDEVMVEFLALLGPDLG